MSRWVAQRKKWMSITVPFIFLGPWVVFGLWPEDPQINVPICTAEGTQEHPRITTDGATGAIIVWQDESPASIDVYAQRIDARGEIRWTKDGVAVCLERGDQWLPNLVHDGEGGAIIAWWDKRSGDMDIYAQRINGNGEILWRPGGVPICTAPGPQQEFDITTDGAGGAIIVWHDYRAKSDAPDIYAQSINAKGQTRWKRDGILVSERVSYQGYPVIVSDAEGGAIIAWHDWRDGDGDIYAQRVSAEGRLLWQKNGVPVCKTSGHQWYAGITADTKGGAIITWMDYRNGEDWDVYAQRIDPQGVPLWQVNGVPVCTAKGDQYDYCIVGDDTGGAFICWRDQRSGEWDIYIQKLDAEGNAKWTKDGLPVCTEPKGQYNPNMVSDGAGGVIITWWDERDTSGDIYAQRISANGEPLWTESGVAICIAEGGQQDPYPVNSGVGSAIITWWDKRRVDADIYAQRVFSE